MEGRDRGKEVEVARLPVGQPDQRVKSGIERWNICVTSKLPQWPAYLPGVVAHHFCTATKLISTMQSHL